MKIFEIPSILGIHYKVNALGDTCAKKNFMKTAYAERLKLEIDRANVSSVTIGSRKQLVTTGTVRAAFRFINEPKVFSLVFHLIPDCIHDVILGKPFLKATRTFTSLLNQTRRVVKRMLDRVTQRHVLYLGDNTTRFTGLLNGRSQEALADSGSKVLLMDEDYARTMGLPIISSPQHCIKLRFADSSTTMTSGMVFGVKWEFGPTQGSEEYILDFHIIKKALAPVILSDEFLFDTNAFSKFECFLIDEDDEGKDEDAYFLAIDIDSNYHPANENLPTDSEDLTELVRRGEEDDRIADLPAAERAGAESAEKQRRDQWDAQRNNQRHATSPSNTGTPVTTSSQQGNSTAPDVTKRS
ncbi:hypothetical protein GQ44DRAFT_609601 [Phaeosphaeriaceae sp. PMI808]|nr:hypothetical protein GQ44DRAFT_609601 [Phaeosphaeriaceae sp. PMI808]